MGDAHNQSSETLGGCESDKEGETEKGEAYHSVGTRSDESQDGAAGERDALRCEETSRDTLKSLEASKVESTPATLPRWKRKRVLKTIATYACFFAIGVEEAILGPTLLHLVLLFDTDLKSLTACMFVSGIAYVIGSFFGGYLVDRMNQEIFFALTEFISVSGFIIMPWTGHLFGFAVVLLVSDVCAAMVDAGGQSYLLNLWEGSKHKDSIIQGMQFVRAIGSMIAPFLAQPFLVPLPDAISDHNTSSVEYTVDVNISGSTQLLNSSAATISIGSDLGVNVSKLSYGFLIAGCIGYVGSLIFCLAARTPCSCSIEDGAGSRTDSAGSDQLTKEDRVYRTVVFSFFFLSFIAYQWLESIPGFFIAAFVVEGEGWDVSMGSLISTVFWASHTVGLLLGIFLAGVFSTSKLLVASLTLTTISTTVLTLFGGLHPAVAWATIAVAGVAMSTIFGSNLLLASSYIKVDGFGAAVFLLGSSVGYTTCYPLTGYLFEEYSHMWMAYLTLIACGVSIALFVGLHIFHEVYSKKRMSDKPRTLELEPIAVVS